MPMYNLIEYGNNHSKISGSLWQHYRDEQTLNNAGALVDFLRNIAWFKFKQKVSGSTREDGTKVVKIIVPLKYLSNFWRNRTMLEINPILTWSANRVISNAATKQATIFAITDTKLYVPVVTLSTEDNANYCNN